MASDEGQRIWLPNSVMRERAKVSSTTVAALDAVRGFLKPRYVDEMPDGRRVAELHAHDLQRVIDGYACGECLAFFDQRFEKCPACGHKLDPNTDVVDWQPDYWKPSPSRTSEEILRMGGI